MTAKQAFASDQPRGQRSQLYTLGVKGFSFSHSTAQPLPFLGVKLYIFLALLLWKEVMDLVMESGTFINLLDQIQRKVKLKNFKDIKRSVNNLIILCLLLILISVVSTPHTTFIMVRSPQQCFSQCFCVLQMSQKTIHTNKLPYICNTCVCNIYVYKMSCLRKNADVSHL